MGLTDRETFKGVPAKHVYFILLHQQFFSSLCTVQCGKENENTTPLSNISRVTNTPKKGWEKKITNHLNYICLELNYRNEILYEV